MIRDITEQLRRASNARGAWTPTDASHTAEAIAGFAPSRSVEWDYDAGEAWERVLDSDGVVALISVETPLVVLRHSEGDPVAARDPRPEIVRIRAIDGRELRADRLVLVAAFPALEDLRSEDRDRFNPERFTAEELWVATV